MKYLSLVLFTAVFSLNAFPHTNGTCECVRHLPVVCLMQYDDSGKGDAHLRDFFYGYAPESVRRAIGACNLELQNKIETGECLKEQQNIKNEESNQ